MPTTFVTRERPTTEALVPMSTSAASTDLLNRTNPDSVKAFEEAYGKPITNDAELAEAKTAYFAKVNAAVAEYAAKAEPNDPVAAESTTLTAQQQAEYDAANDTKSMFDKLKEGCTAKPFGPVCSMCTKFPNDQAYADLLNSYLNKAANAIAFSKVFGKAFNGDTSLLQRLGLCALNITRAATSGVRALAVAKAMVGDPKALEALATIVLQRGGWLDPLDYLSKCVFIMDDTVVNITAIMNTCNSPYYGGRYYSTGSFYQARPFPLSDRVAYDLDSVQRLSRHGSSVSLDALTVSDPNASRISRAVVADLSTRPR